jgi:hypothetical protein
LSPKLLVTAACVALAACSGGEPGEANAVTAEASAIAGNTASTPRAPASDSSGLAPLTADGWGPLKIGMTLAEITQAMGPDSNPEAVGGPDPESCDQFRPERAPEGMLVMVENKRLTRISLIRDSTVKTGQGLGLGATPAQVRAAYGPALRSGPHKYVESPAEYLVAWTNAGGPIDGTVPPDSRGINYEVDGTGKVNAIHAGGPSILYVEGCA